MLQIKPGHILITAAILAAPMLLWRDFTPDNELRYLSIADEALRNGSVFAFRNHSVPYADKPPLYMWLLMACRRLFGGWTMWHTGLLSLIPALITTGVMERWTRGKMPRGYRLTAMSMLLTTAMFLGSSIVVRMDMLMTMFIVLAVREFYIKYSHTAYIQHKDSAGTDTKGRGLTRRASLGGRFGVCFPILLFLALFTKGPLGVLIPAAGITLFLFTKKELRRWTEFFGLRTWAVLGGLSAVWLTAAYIEGGGSYVSNLLFHQTVGRAVNAFHHQRPLWYYCVASLYTFAPWTLLITGVLTVVLKRRLIRTDLERLFLCMAVATFFLLTCISSKLAIYMLPMLPFTVYLVMMKLQHFEDSLWPKLCLAVPAVATAAAMPALYVLTWRGGLADFRQTGTIAAAAVLSAAGILACNALMTRKPLCNAIMHIACGLGLALFAAGLPNDKLNSATGYGQACRRAAAMSRQYGVPVLVDNKIKNTADMDVYMDSFRLVQTDSMSASNNTVRGVLITKGHGAEKLTVRLLPDKKN